MFPMLSSSFLCCVFSIVFSDTWFLLFVVFFFAMEVVYSSHTGTSDYIHAHKEWFTTQHIIGSVFVHLLARSVRVNAPVRDDDECGLTVRSTDCSQAPDTLSDKSAGTRHVPRSTPRLHTLCRISVDGFHKRLNRASVTSKTI